jgi:hypothetical protein
MGVEGWQMSGENSKISPKLPKPRLEPETHGLTQAELVTFQRYVEACGNLADLKTCLFS